MRHATGAALALGLVISACVATPDEDTCGAAGLSYLIGLPERATLSLPRGMPIRILRPGSVRTEDYRPDRINIEVGFDGYVTSIWCG